MDVPRKSVEFYTFFGLIGGRFAKNLQDDQPHNSYSSCLVGRDSRNPQSAQPIFLQKLSGVGFMLDNVYITQRFSEMHARPLAAQPEMLGRLFHKSICAQHIPDHTNLQGKFFLLKTERPKSQPTSDIPTTKHAAAN